MVRFLAFLNLLGVISSFAGGLLLSYALTLKSSNYRLVETSDHKVAICLDDKLVSSGFGGGIIVGDEPCPPSVGPSRAPVIEAERPEFFSYGLRLLWGGFLMQLPAASLALRKPSVSAPQ